MWIKSIRRLFLLREQTTQGELSASEQFLLEDEKPAISPAKLVLTLAVGLVVITVVLYSMQEYAERERPGKYFDTQRDYQRMPFDINDATAICKRKTKSRFGDQLVRAFVDDHSTRFEYRQGIYKVFMQAQLGNLYLHQDAPVHCFVDPGEHMISHYRTFEKRESLMTRALSFVSLR